MQQYANYKQSKLGLLAGTQKTLSYQIKMPSLLSDNRFEQLRNSIS